MVAVVVVVVVVVGGGGGSATGSCPNGSGLHLGTCMLIYFMYHGIQSGSKITKYPSQIKCIVSPLNHLSNSAGRKYAHIHVHVPLRIHL